MNGLTKVDTVALKEKKKPKTKMAINRFETVNCLRKKNCRRKKKKKKFHHYQTSHTCTFCKSICNSKINDKIKNKKTKQIN